MNTQRIYEEHTTLLFEFNICGLKHQLDKKEMFEASQSVKDYPTLGCWLCINSVDFLHLWLFGTLVYLIFFSIEEYKILWFEFNLCGLWHWQKREESFEASQSTKDYQPFGCWIHILSGDSVHSWLLGALLYLNLFGIDTVENSWGVTWITRDFKRKVQSFGSSSICGVCGIGNIGKRALKLAIKWKTTYHWFVDFVFFLVTVCACDYYAL